MAVASLQSSLELGLSSPEVRFKFSKQPFLQLLYVFCWEFIATGRGCQLSAYITITPSMNCLQVRFTV